MNNLVVYNNIHGTSHELVSGIESRSTNLKPDTTLIILFNNIKKIELLIIIIMMMIKRNFINKNDSHNNSIFYIIK
jgi:hypothetical protein